MKKKPEHYLLHIVENADDVESFLRGVSKDQFMNSKLMQNAVMRSIEIISEAAYRLRKHFPDIYDQIPGKDIIGQRNIILHQYEDVDLDLVWQTATEKIPEQKRKVEKILASQKHRANEQSRGNDLSL